MSKLFLERSDARIISQVRRMPQVNRLKEILKKELHRRRGVNESSKANKQTQADVNAVKELIAILFDDELGALND